MTPYLISEIMKEKKGKQSNKQQKESDTHLL